MIILVKKPLAFTKMLVFIVTLSAVYTVAAAQIDQSGQAYSDTLIAVSTDVKLHVIEAGPKEAQSIILIPGWCFTAEIWKKQFAELSDRYHVISFDPRSQGKSTILNHSNSPDYRAEDIASLVKTLHLQKPVIVGWSQGVQDVAAYALKFGTGKVGGIVLVDATVSAGTARFDTQTAEMMLRLMPIYMNSPRDYLEGMMNFIFKKTLSPDELNTIVTAALQTPSSIGISNLVLDLFGKDYRQAFKRNNVPTLIIVADTAPDKVQQLQQQIPNATSEILEGTGHAVFYDEPAKFNDLIEKFIEERVKGNTIR